MARAMAMGIAFLSLIPLGVGAMTFSLSMLLDTLGHKATAEIAAGCLVGRIVVTATFVALGVISAAVLARTRPIDAPPEAENAG